MRVRQQIMLKDCVWLQAGDKHVHYEGFRPGRCVHAGLVKESYYETIYSDRPINSNCLQIYTEYLLTFFAEEVTYSYFPTRVCFVLNVIIFMFTEKTHMLSGTYKVLYYVLCKVMANTKTA